MLLKVERFQRHAPARQVGRRRHQDGFGRIDFACDHVGVKTIAGANQGDVEVFDWWFAVRLDLDVEPYVWVCLAEARDQRREHVGGEHGGRQDAQHARERVGV
ncbi:hypothetical protein D9M69_661440 [compost metagenome]